MYARGWNAPGSRKCFASRSLMTAWYRNNPGLFRKEQAALEAAQPGLGLEVQQSGFRINRELCLKREGAVAAGIYTLTAPGAPYYDYRIAVLPPDNYPASPCLVFCNDLRLPIGNIDRHILSNGQACLAVPGDLHRRWNPAAGIARFLEEFVSPFLAWQVFYDAHGHPPPWGQRAHGIEGIIEFYAETLGVPAGPCIPGFVPLFARKNPPQGHEMCPCGSGLRLRNCHAAALREARSRIPWQAARHDLSVLAGIARNGAQGDARKPAVSAEPLSASTTTAASEGLIRTERR
jgi:hypothetical protein